MCVAVPMFTREMLTYRCHTLTIQDMYLCFCLCDNTYLKGSE